MKTPAISILIPVYNVEKYIEECLRSLFINTIISDCEIILVDDCSPDKSMEVVHCVLADFPDMKNRVLLHSHDFNRGSAAARNTGLLQAHGKYIICVDSDDWVEPNYLEELYRKAIDTDADIVGCNLNKEFPHKSICVCNMLPNLPGLCIRDLLLGNLQGWLHVKMIRRSLLVDNDISWVDGLDLWEDVLLSLKIFVYAKKIENVDASLYHYRFNSQSLVNTFSEKRIEDLVGIVKEIETFLQDNNLLDIYNDAFLTMKTRVKISILCESNIQLQKKYCCIYPEVDEKINCTKSVSKVKRIAACLILKQKFFLSSFLLFLVKLGRKIKYR